jgi:hypothetical protein
MTEDGPFAEMGGFAADRVAGNSDVTGLIPLAISPVTKGKGTFILDNALVIV